MSNWPHMFRAEWEPWFAWHPVRIKGRWVWWRTVRRRFIDAVLTPWGFWPVTIYDELPPPPKKRGGTNGGHARAKALTPERRSEIARHAAKARWSKRP